MEYYVHANKNIAVYPPVQPYTSTTNHVTKCYVTLWRVHLEKVGTSLNAFINVQLRIYFIALYVNLVELRSDFLYIYHATLMNPFKSKTKKEKKQLQ